MDTKIYKSKVDWWLRLLLGGLFLVLFWSTLDALVLSRIVDLLSAAFNMAFLIYCLAVLYVFALPTEYEINSELLEIRSGIIQRKIPLGEIQSAKFVRNFVTAPALSIDRIQIDYLKDNKNRTTWVSPKSRLEFLESLAEASTGLELEDEQLQRCA